LKKPDAVEQALDRLAALKNEAGTPQLARELTVFLKNRSNLVVAKAAKVAAHVRETELVPMLVEAFHRLMKNPSKLDKACAATSEIIGALDELDYPSPRSTCLAFTMYRWKAPLVRQWTRRPSCGELVPRH